MSKAKKISIVLVNKVLLKSGYHYPDEIIECDKSEAERLIRLDAAVPCAEIYPRDLSSDSDKPVGQRSDVMEGYIVAAEKAIEAGFVTASGAPEVQAMEKILGCNISAEDRDAAWAALKIVVDNGGDN